MGNGDAALARALRAMTRRAIVRSLAKINLDLRVLHKNPDGFHDLRTVFQTISLADTIGIEFAPARQRKVTIEDETGIPDNLIVRAAHAVLDEMKIAARVHFRLIKRIPMGGGLGGGSSNAAAVLLALPVLTGRALSMEARMRIAASLGSDVPFFLLGGTALGMGRGTELYPLADLAPEPLLIVSPGLHIATPEAYRALGRSLTFTGSSSSINTFQSYVRALIEGRAAGTASALGANDFEAAVSSQFPQLKTIVGKLRKLDAVGVRMTGSGSAVFAIFRSRKERERARTVLQGDRVFEGFRLLAASLVSRTGYRRLWRRQLLEHIEPRDNTWPLPSRYDKR